MGCGKTYWGKKLAAKIGYHFIDIDTEIEITEQQSIATIFATKGENYFREIEYQQLVKIITTTNAHTIIATGGGTPCFFNAIHLMNEKGITIWLNETIENIISRLPLNNFDRPLLNTTSSANLSNQLSAILQQRKDCYNQSKHIISSLAINENTLLQIINND